jgi:hypothetical protein
MKGGWCLGKGTPDRKSQLCHPATKTGEEAMLLPPFTDFSKRQAFASEICTWLLCEATLGRNSAHNPNGVFVNKVECYNQFQACPV